MIPQPPTATNLSVQRSAFRPDLALERRYIGTKGQRSEERLAPVRQIQDCMRTPRHNLRRQQVICDRNSTKITRLANPENASPSRSPQTLSVWLAEQSTHGAASATDCDNGGMRHNSARKTRACAGSSQFIAQDSSAYASSRSSDCTRITPDSLPANRRSGADSVLADNRRLPGPRPAPRERHFGRNERRGVVCGRLFRRRSPNYRLDDRQPKQCNPGIRRDSR